jgi:hypothetical protein
LQTSDGPVFADVASIGAWLGLLGSRKMRQAGGAAVAALGAPATMGRVWDFTWRWWYQRSVDELLSYQIERLTVDWATQHVTTHGSLPRGGCVLVSIHQFNQHVAVARASALEPDLGLISMLEPEDQVDDQLPREDFLVPRGIRLARLTRFYAEAFGGRIFKPSVAARGGLELLSQGGSLIVLPDFFGERHGQILGRSIPVADGPIWWANRSGRPMVPFCLAPPRDAEQAWQLIIGEPVPGTREALVAAVESTIRRAPTTWMSWRGWHAAASRGS